MNQNGNTFKTLGLACGLFAALYWFHKRTTFAVGLFQTWLRILTRRYFHKPSSKKKNKAFFQLVGNTPLVRLECLSDDLGLDVYGKAEFLNPGGSTKDRVAVAILEDAQEKQALQHKGDAVYEGTSGSTGISLTLAAQAMGYQAFIYLPNDQASEKKAILNVLGAHVVECPPCSIIDPQHYCNASRTDANCPDTHSNLSQHKCYFADQFDNLANYQTHYHTTGKEIWDQMDHHIDGFVASCGTGGTLTGVAKRLHENNPNIKIVLGDPQGSALYNKIRFNVLYNEKDAEGCRTRHMHDTIVEGVGVNRVTKNFLQGYKIITQAYQISDLEVVHMAHYLIRREGLFLGSSSALNCCCLVKAVMDGVFKKNSRVALILCDSGVRHLSRFYNKDYLASLKLLPNYLRNTQTLTQPFQVPHDANQHNPSLSAALAETFPQSVFDFIDPPNTTLECYTSST